MQQGLKKDDIITVTFDVQGIKYTDKDNKTQVVTSIRPYKIEKVQPKVQAPAGHQQAQAPAPAAGGDAPIPGDGNNLPF